MLATSVDTPRHLARAERMLAEPRDARTADVESALLALRSPDAPGSAGAPGSHERAVDALKAIDAERLELKLVFASPARRSI